MATLTINGTVNQIREGSTTNGSQWDVGGDSPQNACFIKFPTTLPNAKIKSAQINWRITSYGYRAATPFYVQACGKYTSTINGKNQPTLLGIRDETQINANYTGDVTLNATNAIISSVSENLDAIYVKVYTNNGKNRKHMTNSPSLTVTYVDPPKFNDDVADKTVNAGSMVSFTCSATGANTYAWYKNGTLASSVPTYMFTPTRTDNNATIYCVIGNEAGTARSNDAKLTVRFAPYNVTIPDIEVGVGETGVMKATFADGNPPFSGVYSWKVDGDAVSETSDTLEIPYGDYETGEHTVSVTVENEVGIATGNATFDITSRIPSVYVPSIVCEENSEVSITAMGDLGVPTAECTWTKNGSEEKTGQTVSYYFTRGDNGAEIKLTAVNDAGTSVDTGTATVYWDAEILTQPTNKVFSGSPVTFVVTATGNPSPSYQWYKNGVPMDGETGNTLTVLGEFSSEFFCRVSNVGATVDSDKVGVIPNAGTARKPEKKFAFYMKGNKLYSPYYYDNGAKEFEK